MAFTCIRCNAAIDPQLPACPNCREPITDFLRKYRETLVDGKYKLLSRLGMGGMGEVYKALHVHLDSVRVIKFSLSADPGALERFTREARIATRIQHPHVATLHDFSTLPDGSFYMVWEYIEGIDLVQLIREEGAISPKYAAVLAIQALTGLDAIHRAGIIHRDISPDNIMITTDEHGDDRIKIIDLGIAKQADGGDSQTQAGMFIGKIRYASPEQLGFLAPDQKIDGRADIYSFGIVLYEMLSGTLPFGTTTPHQYMVKQMTEPPRPLDVANSALAQTPELVAAVSRALSKERNDRFATARDFARELERLLPSLPGQIPVPDLALHRRTTPGTTPVPTTERGIINPVPYSPTVAVPGYAARSTQRSGQTDPTTVVPAPALDRTVMVPAYGPSRRTPWLALAILALFVVAAGAAAVYFLRTKPPVPIAAVNPRPAETRRTGPAINSAVTAPRPASTVTSFEPVSEPAEPPASTIIEIVEPAPQPVPPVPSTKRSTKVPVPSPAPTEEEETETPAAGNRQPEGETRYVRRSNKLIESEEFNEGDFIRGIIPNYSNLQRGDSVNWSYIAPGTKLAEHSIKVGSFRNLTRVSSPRLLEILQQDLQSQLDDVAEGSSSITTQNGIYWAENGRSKKRGVGIEMIFKDSNGRVVAMLRHLIHEGSPEDAAEEMLDAVSEFVEESD